MVELRTAGGEGQGRVHSRTQLRHACRHENVTGYLQQVARLSLFLANSRFFAMSAELVLADAIAEGLLLQPEVTGGLTLVTAGSF